MVCSSLHFAIVYAEKKKKKVGFTLFSRRFAGSMIDCMSTTTHNLKKNASYVFAGVRTKLENMTIACYF